MTTIRIQGLTGSPRHIPYQVTILSNPQESDPAQSSTYFSGSQVLAASPNEQWALIRRGGVRTSIIALTHPTESVDLPYDESIQDNGRCYEMNNEGDVLLQGQKEGDSDPENRCPIIFRRNKKSYEVIESPLPSSREECDEPRPIGHTPRCFLPNGSIFGSAYAPYLRGQSALSDFLYCVWHNDSRNPWHIEYFGDALRGKICHPLTDRTFFWADCPEECTSVQYGISDGYNLEVAGAKFSGESTRIISTTSQGSILGSITLSAEKIPTFFFIRLPENEFYLFSEFTKTKHELTRMKMSMDGTWLVAAGEGKQCLMKFDWVGYEAAWLINPVWRIDHIGGITTKGQVLAAATCLDRSHSCYRLQLPVLFTPQWS